MSEFINNSWLRRNRLLELGLGMLNGKRDPEYVHGFDEAIEAATPRDVFFVVDGMVKTGKTMAAIKKAVSQFINLLYLALLDEGLQTLPKGSFLSLMAAENREMEKRMDALKPMIKTINRKDIEPDQFKQIQHNLHEQIIALNEYQKHYIRKENILFPQLEKVWKDFRCMHVMWSMHDDMRNAIKNLDGLLLDKKMDLGPFNREIGKLFFAVYPVIYREENILFPLAHEDIDVALWKEMQKQAAEIGYAFIEPPPIQSTEIKKNRNEEWKHTAIEEKPGLINLGSGILSIEQIILIFIHLPVDITFVDAHDEVRYFNLSKERHFTRSLSIIGRKVQNCHPPDSIDVVNKIVESFRNGTKDHEDFWIRMNGRLILIRYFAIRDEQGHFRGTLEVSQDITEIKSLEGERRLLDQ